ncbi:MAG: recombinase family protein [Lachnospiraceae bacterium]
MTKKIRCAIYDRVSSDIQVMSGLSLDTQKEDLTVYAQSHGYVIVDYYVDEGITARKKMQNRKDFLRLLKDIQQDKIDLVLVTKLDRWFRNVRDYHNIQAILEQHHCNWKTIHEDYDTITADGQLKINIMLAVAQNECDRTSERIKAVFAHKLRNKDHITGAAPYGYILSEKKLQKDPNTQHIVDDIFNHYFSCFSKRKTIQYVLDTYGELAPTKYQANRLLTHEAYAGLYKGISNYNVAYITEEQHQMILNVCDSKTYPATSEPYIFSGLLKCPYCGATLTGFKKRQTLKNGSIHSYKRYRCCNKYQAHSSGVCLTESVVEQYVLNNIYPVLQQNYYDIKASNKTPSKKKDDSKKYQDELHRLSLLFQKGHITEEYYDVQHDLLSKKLQEELDANKIISVEAYRHLQQQFTSNWKDMYLALDYAHKNAFWKRIIKQIVISKETHKVCGIIFIEL